MMKAILRTLLAFTLFCAFANQAKADAPAGFKINGYHLDLRIQVIKMPALKAFVKQLRAGGINTLIMEWEATYPFKKYPVISNQYAYTPAEIKSFMRFCDSLKMDVIPLQQSFGHVEYILRNYRFADIREDQRDFSQVCPSEEAADRALFTDLFKELVATHKSKYFHIGGDETYLLGHCEKCKKKVAEEGVSKLYIDHIRMLCDILIKLGKVPVLWADIALKHPEAIKLLPKETVFIDWNYGWDLNRFGNIDNLLKSGYEIWGAPSIRCAGDNYYLTLWQEHFNNLHDFIPAARKMNYTGMVLTSWATTGIFNPIFNSGYDIIDDYPRGHRYPFTGYNMLLQAYFESARSSSPLNISDFIKRYAHNNFGFNAAQAALFWKALGACPYEIRQGKVIAPNLPLIAQMRDSTRWAGNTLRQLKPQKGLTEYAHLQLMTDIRLQFLEAYVVEDRLNRGQVDAVAQRGAAATLKTILAKSADLDRRFIALNQATFYLSELQSENKLRSAYIQTLYNRVAKNRTASASTAFVEHE